MSTITGTSGSDTLNGTSRSDTISGGSGSDTLNGGAGTDLLFGGSGNDTLNGGDGNDLLLGGAGSDILSGGSGSDVLSGGSGNDQLSGGSGNDLLEGGSGSDILDGGSGQDVLLGGSGNDVLIGVGGADWIQGGSGNDLFVYLSESDSNASNWDRILDFNRGKDKIDLSALLGTTDLAWGGQTALANGVWYSNLDSKTFVYADTDGDGAANLKIELKNACGLTLSASDFLGVGGRPVAHDSFALGSEDAVVTGWLPAFDPDGGALGYSVVSGPAHGTLVVHANGSYSYTPDSNFNGSDAFTFKANDGVSDSNVATIALTVSAVNDAPVAQNSDGAASEDASYDGWVVASDVDGNSLTYSLVAPVDGVTFNPDGSFTVAPLASDQGLDDGESRDVTFQYVANDGSLDSTPATVTVTINGSNDAPVAQAVSDTTDEDSLLNGTLAANDVDGENLSFSLVAPVDGLTVHPSGAFQFDPRGLFDSLGVGASADVTLQFVANDGTVDSAPGIATIKVNGTNDTPVAVDDSAEASLSIGGASGNVLTDDKTFDSDVDRGDTLKVTSLEGKKVDGDVFVAGKFGNLFMLDSGDWSYSLIGAPDTNDVEVFNYTVADQNGAIDSATLTITVSGTGGTPAADSAVVAILVDAPSTLDDGGNGQEHNTAPVAVADEFKWNDGGISGNVLANDLDPDTDDILFVTEVRGNAVDGDAFVFGDYGFLFVTNSGDWSYQLTNAGVDALAKGVDVDDVFGYTIQDAAGATASSTFTVHVTDGDFVL